MKKMGKNIYFSQYIVFSIYLAIFEDTMEYFGRIIKSRINSFSDIRYFLSKFL